MSNQKRELVHGELIRSHNVRWCAKHKFFHGALYECESYTVEVIDEIQTSDANYLMKFRIIIVMIFSAMIAMLATR
jgi:gamma-glutamylcyclotransferase (GGCT)/AIG2-like uncharacterized protein YtfP